MLVAAQSAVKTENLQYKWQFNRKGQMLPYRNENTQTIYFWLTADDSKSSRLKAECGEPYSLFINSQLVWSGIGTFQFSVDSLSQLYGSKLWVSLHTNRGVKKLKTFLIEEPRSTDALVNEPRPGNYFLDFVLLASLFLLMAFTLFVRTNPVLTQDYFDFRKLMIVQDSAESNFGLRIASSVNILFYFFGSCLLALILLVVYKWMQSQTTLSVTFSVTSAADGFRQWAILSLSVFAVLVIKLVWVALMALLFGFKDTVRFQFFNFVRLIFISVAILVAVSFAYYFFNVRQPLFYYYQIYLLVFLFLAGTVMTYFKLMARLPFHFFHLFSYLCASEIIPLMLLMKVVLY